MSKRSFSLIAAFGLIAGLAFATPSQAGPTYTTSVTVSGTVSVTEEGVTATISPSTISGGGTAPQAPSTAGASDAIGGYDLVYSGGSFPPYYAYLSGTYTYDVTVTDTASTHSHTFVVTATFANVVASNLTPATPLLGGGGNSAVIGNYLYTLDATSIGTNINVPGTAIFVGFESSAIPEPTSMSLLGIGMAGFLAFRRFYNKKNAGA